MGFYDRPYAGGGGYRGTGGGGMGGLGAGIRVPGRRSVTFWLLVVNVAVFFVDAFLGRAVYGRGSAGLLAAFGAFSFEKAIESFQVWRFVTYQFLHSQEGIGHIFFNMLALFFFGPMLEAFLGSKRFLGYYLLCGVAGAVLYLILLGVGQMVPNPDRVPFLLVGDLTDGMVGASAAIFGVLIGAWRVAPNATVLLFFIIPIPLRVLILLVLLFEVYVVMAGGFNAGGRAAHLGGAALGYLLMRHPAWLNFFERINVGAARQRLREKTEKAHVRREQTQEQEIDRILAKVHRDGLASLTEREKRTLKEATDRKRAG